MLRRDLQAKNERCSSYPISLTAVRESHSATLLEQPIPTTGSDTVLADGEHIRSIEAFQLLLDSQRQEIAEKDAALESFKLTTRDITISTIPGERLMGLPILEIKELFRILIFTQSFKYFAKNMADHIIFVNYLDLTVLRLRFAVLLNFTRKLR
jgi:hypothetical protein